MKQRLFVVLGLAVSGVVAACGGEKSATTDTTASASSAAASSPSSGSEATPAAGGKVIVIKLITDETSNRFEPNKIEAKKGDVLRFTLQAGVHNVHFLADSNPGKTLDIPVTFAEGKYYFQCDPHAALGMIGHLEVED